MRLIAPVTLCLLVGLAACSREATLNTNPKASGRYLGMGVYTPGELWTKLAAAKAPSDAGAARITDDDQILVVVDSYTGEVRQCGNLSGVCVAMNPWKQVVPQGLVAPARVSQHAVSAETETSPAQPAPLG